MRRLKRYQPECANKEGPTPRRLLRLSFESLRQCRPEGKARLLIKRLHNFLQELHLCHSIPLHLQYLFQGIHLDAAIRDVLDDPFQSSPENLDPLLLVGRGWLRRRFGASSEFDRAVRIRVPSVFASDLSTDRSGVKRPLYP